MTRNEIIAAIRNGATFNGTVYRKNYGQDKCIVFVYVDGVECRLDRIHKSKFPQFQNEFLAEIAAPAAPAATNIYPTSNYTMSVLDGTYVEE